MDQGSQVLDPGWGPWLPGRDGSAAEGGRGTRNGGNPRCLPVALGYFWTGVALFSSSPFSSWRRAPMFVCLRTTY